MRLTRYRSIFNVYLKQSTSFHQINAPYIHKYRWHAQLSRIMYALYIYKLKNKKSTRNFAQPART